MTVKLFYHRGLRGTQSHEQGFRTRRSQRTIAGTAKKQSRKLNAARASHPDRIVRGFLNSSPLPMERLLRPDSNHARVEHETAFAEADCIPDLAIGNCNHYGSQQPCPATRARWEEAATPGQPARAMRVFWKSPGNSPSRITGFAAGSPQSLSEFRNSPRFRWRHCRPYRFQPQQEIFTGL